MKNVIALAAVAGLAVAATAQDFEIYAVAPAQTNWDTTYTVEVWGSVTGGSWVDGLSAIAGFGIDVLATGGAANVDSITTSLFAPWVGFPTSGTVDGANLLNTSGGQLANLFGFLNPDIDLSNPIMLFSFDVTVVPGAGVSSITYTPGNPNPNGGLSFYPDNQDGASVVAPNTPGTTLTLTGGTTQIIPAPASLALLGLGGLVARRRR